MKKIIAIKILLSVALCVTILKATGPASVPGLITSTATMAIARNDNSTDIVCYRFHKGCIYRKNDNLDTWKQVENDYQTVIADAKIPEEVNDTLTNWEVRNSDELFCQYPKVKVKIEPMDSSLFSVYTEYSRKREIELLNETIPLKKENVDLIKKLLADVVTEYNKGLELDVKANAIINNHTDDSVCQLLLYIPLLATAALIGVTEYVGWSTKASDIIVEKTGLKRFVQKNTPKMILSNPKMTAALVSVAAGTGAAFIPYKKEYMLLKALLAAWPTYKLMHAVFKKDANKQA